MRLLIVSQDFGPKLGGIERYTLALATELAGRGAAVEVLAPAQAGDAAFDRALPVPVRRLPLGSDAMPWTAAPYVLARVGRGQLDAILHTQWQTAAVGAVARAALGLPCLLVAAHGKELLLRPPVLARRLGGRYDALRRACLERADAVLPVSAFTGRMVAATAPRARIHILPNGVDAASFRGGDGARFRAQQGLGDGPLLLTVARLVPRKGIDDVIACLPALRAERPRLTYVVVGAGPDDRRLAALARDYGVADALHFTGSLAAAALRDAYAACDVFVLAPRDEPDSVEGFGLVLLEAAAAGRPAVATDAGGCAEAVVHGRTGIVVPKGDRAQLGRALHALLNDPAYAGRLGAAAAEHARGEASWTRTADRLAAIVARAAPAHGARNISAVRAEG